MITQSLMLFVCLLGFGKAAIPICTEGDQQPELLNGQNYCFFANYSRDVPAIEYHGQSLIDIQVISDLKDIRVNEDRVLWTASIQLDLKWSDNRILMDANVIIFQNIPNTYLIRYTFCQKHIKQMSNNYPHDLHIFSIFFQKISIFFQNFSIFFQ